MTEFCRLVRRSLAASLAGLRLFGSSARGDAVADSGIDVAVIVATAGGGVEDLVIDIAFDIDLAFGVYLSPRVIPTAVLEDPVWRLTGLIRGVEREGLPL